MRPRQVTVILLLVLAVITFVIAALLAVAHRQGRPESFHERKGRLREARGTPEAEEAVSAIGELTLTSTSGLEARVLVYLS